MHAVASRRAGASLFEAFTTAPCKRGIHSQRARRAALLASSSSRAPSSHCRPISSTAKRAQEPPTPSVVSSKPPPTAAQTTATPRPPPPPASAAAPRPSPPSQPTNDNADTPLRSLTEGFDDSTPFLNVEEDSSFHGLSTVAVSAEAAQILTAPIDAEDVEIKPDGIVYLPEIKYRRILNRAFGPGGWGLAPRGETIITGRLVTREYGLMCHGRLISIARGEQQYFEPDGIPTATEGCKSNALMRCCKDLGVASELWDPRYIRKFMAEHARELMVEHVTTKKRRKHFMRKDVELKYPWKEVAIPGSTTAPAAGLRR